MSHWTRRILLVSAVASGAAVVGGCSERYDETGAARRSTEASRTQFERTTRSDLERPAAESSISVGSDAVATTDTGLYGDEQGLGGSGMEGTGSAPTQGASNGTAVGRDSTAAMKDKAVPSGAGMAVAKTAPAEVLAKLHHTNQMEVKMGELAKANAKQKGVKEYGERLISDHKKADSELMAYAKKQNLTVGAPTTVPESEMKAHHAKMEELKMSKEAGFDQKFLAAMLEGHEKAITDVTAARDAATEPELKAMLDKLLPTLKEHRDTAQKLEANAGPKTSPHAG